MTRLEDYTFFAEELFAWIIDDIRQKYDIDNPIFIVKNHPEFQNNEVLLIKWINNKIYIQGDKWIKYKKITENIFELKEYFPYPPDKICHKMINQTISDAKKLCQNLPGDLFFEINMIVYTEKEIKKRILFSLRRNFSEICLYEPKVEYVNKRTRCICKLSFQQDELGCIIPSGYMPLEQK